MSCRAVESTYSVYPNECPRHTAGAMAITPSLALIILLLISSLLFLIYIRLPGTRLCAEKAWEIRTNERKQGTFGFSLIYMFLCFECLDEWRDGNYRVQLFSQQTRQQARH